MVSYDVRSHHINYKQSNPNIAHLSHDEKRYKLALFRVASVKIGASHTTGTCSKLRQFCGANVKIGASHTTSTCSKIS